MSDVGLVERLECLERDNRRLKRTVLVALVLIGALMATGFHGAPIISAKNVAHEFDVVDGSGRTRIRMDIGALGQPEISLLDAQGAYRAQMYLVTEGEPSIALQDKPLGRSSVTFLGAGGIAFLDGQGSGMNLGTGSVTPGMGHVEGTSAASIVMFRTDKEQHIIWKAPE